MIKNCQFIKNKSTENGGAIESIDTEFYHYEDNFFDENYAPIRGGAIYQENANLDKTHSVLLINQTIINNIGV